MITGTGKSPFQPQQNVLELIRFIFRLSRNNTNERKNERTEVREKVVIQQWPR